MHFNWQVFTEYSGLQIQLHWATALVAFLLGLVIFARVKGTRAHIIMGATYMTLMLVTSISAFFVRRGDVTGWSYLSLDGMTWIHLFIPLTLFGIFGGLYGILVKRDRIAHRGPLIWSYLGGLVIAGVLTFIPGRRMHAVFFEDPEALARAAQSLP